MNRINSDMSIKEILDRYPETVAVFSQFGFTNFSDENVIKTLGPFLKLKTLLKHRAINEESFVTLCNDSIPEAAMRSSVDLFSDLHYLKPTLLALLPCGLKVSLDRALQHFCEQTVPENQQFHYLAEGNVNHELSFYPYIDSVESADELPDIILSADLNAFFHHRFISRFVRDGIFRNVSTGMNKRFSDIGYADPHENFTMFCANTLVIVHVKDSEKTIPTPKSWHDLLSPDYFKSVVMRGQNSFFCSGVLIPFFQLFGMDAMYKLASSVCNGMHPSQMVKMIDSQSNQIPPLYIMPWFFAQRIKHTERIEIIVPEEGAFISPVHLLVKRSRIPALTDIIQFLMSRELHQHCADNYFPSPHPDVNILFPSNKKFYWIGWEYIYKNDLGLIKKTIGENFTSEFVKTGDNLCV